MHLVWGVERSNVGTVIGYDGTVVVASYVVGRRFEITRGLFCVVW